MIIEIHDYSPSIDLQDGGPFIDIYEAAVIEAGGADPFDPALYYTKSETDTAISTATAQVQAALQTSQIVNALIFG